MKGVKEGERNNSIMVARRLIRKDVDISLIEELTDLSIPEIQELKRSME